MRQINSIDEKWNEYENEMWEIGLNYYRQIIDGLCQSNGLVLDIGCGPGQWSAAAIKEGMAVIGCDTKISHKAIELFQRAPQFNLVRANGENLPFKDNCFDVILCELVLPYVNVEKTIIESRRVLKKNGVIHGICHRPGYYLMQGCNEAKRLNFRDARRRFIVLVYTIIHHILHLKNYYYETFQTPEYIKTTLIKSGFTFISIQIGGHPIIKNQKFLNLPTFFEFFSRKS